MRKIALGLGLDLEVIASDLEVCQDLARIYHNHRGPEMKVEATRRYGPEVAAGLWRRAGAHALLLGKVRIASESFAEAVANYALAELPYCVMLGALTSRNLLAPIDRVARKSQGSRPDDVYSLFFPHLAQKGREEGGLHEGLRAALGVYRSYPLGVLGIPVGAYLDLADYLRGDAYQGWEKEVPSLERVLLPFLGAFNHAVETARETRHLWRPLGMPFHPAEPDVMSVMLLVESSIRRRELTLRRILGDFPLSSESRSLLLGVLEQLELRSEDDL